MALQVFGTKKCAETRKLERFLKERRVAYQYRDLAEKGVSPGELRAIAAALGKDNLLDTEGKRYQDRGLRYMEAEAEALALKDPLLLRTPILRDGARAMNRGNPAEWAGFLQK